jgi:hypothetical protein
MYEFDESARENILNDKSLNSDSLNDSINIADNLDQDNLSSYSQNMSQESPSSPNFEDNLNMINLSNDMIKNNVGPSYMDGFSYLKSDEIKEYIHRFGDGNKEIIRNLQQFQNFANSLNNFDKWNSILKPTNLQNNKDQTKKIKKEDKLFQFNSENEVNRKDIFDKDKKNKDNSNVFKKENLRKRKVKQFFHYDQRV